MKKLFLQLLMLFATTALLAQWVPVPIGASSSAVTSMFAYADTVMAGTDGDGIFKTMDQGTSWTDVSGNIGNTFINDIRGGGGPKVIWAATENGAYFTPDHINYENCAATGLSTNDITYFWFGDGSENAEWAIGTNGGGLYTSPELNGPWNYSGNGLSGAGLIINDLSGYSDDEVEYAALATNNGVYFSWDSLVNWTPKNTGLSGDQLIVKRLACLGTFVMIATHGGFYYTVDFGDSWVPVFPDEKFNTLLVYPAGTGINIFVLGETGYYSPNMSDFYTIDLSGIPGEVISVATTSTHLFIGTEEQKKNVNSGSIYKIPIDQLITGISNPSGYMRSEITMEQNYPNPFRVSTNISYTVLNDGFISIKIFDFLGREVCDLINEYQTKGQFSVRFEPEGLSEGVYYYIMRADGFAPVTRKMIITK
jgi:hypothetical protein